MLFIPILLKLFHNSTFYELLNHFSTLTHKNTKKTSVSGQRIQISNLKTIFAFCLKLHELLLDLLSVPASSCSSSYKKGQTSFRLPGIYPLAYIYIL